MTYRSRSIFDREQMFAIEQKFVQKNLTPLKNDVQLNYQ